MVLSVILAEVPTADHPEVVASAIKAAVSALVLDPTHSVCLQVPVVLQAEATVLLRHLHPRMADTVHTGKSGRKHHLLPPAG